MLPKNKSSIWALSARAMGNSCPAHWLTMLTWWSAYAHATGISRPFEGHRDHN